MANTQPYEIGDLVRLGDEMVRILSTMPVSDYAQIDPGFAADGGSARYPYAYYCVTTTPAGEPL